MKILLNSDVESITFERLNSELLPQLPKWRRESVLRYKHLAGQREGTAAFLLLQQALREEYGIQDVPPFSYHANGKPYLAEYTHLHFNLSHCHTAVLCAISSQPVGVDVEHIRTARPDLLRYTMNQDEQQQILASAHPDLTFTKLWTRKEALLKLTGEGVGSNMHDILLPDRLQQQGISITTVEGLNCVYSIASYL